MGYAITYLFYTGEEIIFVFLFLNIVTFLVFYDINVDNFTCFIFIVQVCFLTQFLINIYIYIYCRPMHFF